MIIKSDANGFLKNSKELVNLVAEAAKIANVSYSIKPFPIGGGGTDAIPFSRNKLKAVSIYGMVVPKQMIEFYHQPEDNYDKLNKYAIKNALKIELSFLKIISKNKTFIE
ncbi:MAG: M28 family peptidase [Promethearchaeota archaeon]